MPTSKLALGLMFCAIVFSQNARAQANINETLETAFIYVDGTTGSDSNPGTQAQPYKTIGKATKIAIANNLHSIGTRITINPGAYREAISLGNNPSATALPITFQAAVKSKVRISGADVWTGWQPYGANPRIFTHAWPYTWGLCPRATAGPVEQDINLRREMIFVNNVMLTQVLALDQMAPGTFFVDEGNALVYIYPAPSVHINTATVEVSTRAALFAAYGRTNLVLRGLRFEQSNACRYNNAVEISGGSNFLIDSDGFNRNNAGAFSIDGSLNFTVVHSQSNHNGERGFKSYKAKYGVWTSDVANYNNWRGAQGGIYGWAGGGFYFYDQHNNLEQNLRALYNPSHGIHWDTDISNVTARGIITAYNLRGGLLLEKAEGPVTLANNYVCFNAPLADFTDGGMMIRASNFVTLTGNSFSNNHVGQVAFIGVMGGVPVGFSNYETGENYNLLDQNMTFHRNTIVGLPGEQLLYDFDQSGTAWTNFLSTLVSDNNTWWNSGPQPFTIPEPEWYSTTDWPGWRSISSQDKHSTFAAPATDPTLPCQIAPDAPDFWFINVETGSVLTSPGTAAPIHMYLVPIGSFNGQATLKAFGVDQIPGATATWTKTTLNTTDTAAYVVTTSSSTPLGNYPITLTAVSGNVTRTLTAWLSVQEPVSPTSQEESARGGRSHPEPSGLTY